MKKAKFLGVLALATLSLTACKQNKKEDTTTETKTEVPSKTNAEEKPVSTDNSEKTLSGVYFGVLPCADCGGIETTIELTSDNKFKKTLKYQDKKEAPKTTTGDFKLSEDKTKVIIEDATYLVKEGQLVMLDKEGNEVTGKLAENYILKRK